MAVKTGTCAYSKNPITGAEDGSYTIFIPAIGERGRLTLTNGTVSAGYAAYAFLNSTTLGDADVHYSSGAGDFECVFDYIRKGNGITELTYVSGNAGAIGVDPYNTGGNIYFTHGVDVVSLPAPPIDPGAPYYEDDGLVALSRNPYYPLSYRSSASSDYSATYTVFNAGWARGSNQFVGDENNV